jgi:hypothetical protein
MMTQDPFSRLRERPPVLSPKVFERVRADQESLPAKAKSPSRSTRLALSFASTFFVIATLSLRDVLRGKMQVLGWGLIMSLLISVLVLHPTLPGKPAERPRLAQNPRRILLGALLALVAIFFVEYAEAFNSSIQTPPGMASALRCAEHGLIRGGLGLALLVGIWRRTDPFSPRLSAGLLGFAAGLLGVLATTLACRSHEGWHLMIGHALVVALCSGLGFLLGERFLSP